MIPPVQHGFFPMNLTNVSGELLNYSVMCDIFFEYVINIRIAFICTVKCTSIDEFYNCRPAMLPKNWPKIKDASLREVRHYYKACIE